MNPLSNTDTTASARGFNSPLTLIRIDAFLGSETSCICAISRHCEEQSDEAIQKTTGLRRYARNDERL
jgi:hypothetical protein